MLALYLYFSNLVTYYDLIFTYLFLFWKVAHFLTRIFVYDFVRLRFYCFILGVITLVIHWMITMTRFIDSF